MERNPVPRGPAIRWTDADIDRLAVVDEALIEESVRRWQTDVLLLENLLLARAEPSQRS